MERLAVLLDEPAAYRDGDEVPPWWHWLSFTDWPASSELGSDGHPLDGPFMPPLPERRRVFAGARLQVHRPLVVGQLTRRDLSLKAVADKQTRSGLRTFVTVRHEMTQAGDVCLVEEQDLVYRSGATAAGTLPTPQRENGPATSSGSTPWSRGWSADPVLLFRFSALTSNAHRIHYDLPYATEKEAYPGLVVHGPLLALMMAGAVAAAAPDLRASSMSFRLHAPVFADHEVHLTAGTADMGAGGAVIGGDGAVMATYAAALR